MDVAMMLTLLSRLDRLRRRDRWTREAISAHQAAALGGLRAYAYARSPFYQRFHRGLADGPLRELPVLTKAMVMEHFDDLVTDKAIRLEAVRAHLASSTRDRRFLGRYWVNATSGSTGEPGLFLFDRDEWTTALASFARAHEWAGLRVSITHRMRMASVASTTPWHMSAQVGATLGSWWIPALRLAASESPETIVRQLNTWQPEMLVSYASMARILAEEQLAGRLHIHPHLVFTSSEVLTDETRRRVTAAWGHAPFDQYAATETGGLAAECAEGRRLHLFEDLVIVEVVDERNRPAPPGEYGAKLLVTTLFSRTQPLIRYELSDSVSVAGAICECGRRFAVVEDIQGRTEDVLRFPAAAGGEIAVHPVTFHRILDAVPASGWQVVQEPDGVTVVLSGVSAEAVDEVLAQAVRQAAVGQGAVSPRVTVRRVSAIPKSAAGKAPLIRAIGSSVSPTAPAPARDTVSR